MLSNQCNDYDFKFNIIFILYGTIWKINYINIYL